MLRFRAKVDFILRCIDTQALDCLTGAGLRVKMGVKFIFVKQGGFFDEKESDRRPCWRLCFSAPVRRRVSPNSNLSQRKALLSSSRYNASEETESAQTESVPEIPVNEENAFPEEIADYLLAQYDPQTAEGETQEQLVERMWVLANNLYFADETFYSDWVEESDMQGPSQNRFIDFDDLTAHLFTRSGQGGAAQRPGWRRAVHHRAGRGILPSRRLAHRAVLPNGGLPGAGGDG